MNVWILLTSNILIFLTAIVGVYVSYKSNKSIEGVHILVNSRLTEFKKMTEELLEKSIAAALAEGREAGLKEAHDAKTGSIPNNIRN